MKTDSENGLNTFFHLSYEKKLPNVVFKKIYFTVLQITTGKSLLYIIEEYILKLNTF